MISPKFSNENKDPSKVVDNKGKLIHSSGMSYHTQVLPKHDSKKQKHIPTFDIQQQDNSKQTESRTNTKHNKIEPMKSSTVRASGDEFIDELLNFPSFSSHSFSYNPLSPNSLFMRLIILKRTLEIMIHNPSLIKEPSSTLLNEDIFTPVPSHITNTSPNNVFSRPYLNSSKSTNDLFHTKSTSTHPSMLRHNSAMLHKRSASNAAMNAFFSESSTPSSIGGSDSRRSSIINSSSINNISSFLANSSLIEDQDMDFSQPVAPFLKRQQSYGFNNGMNHQHNFVFNNLGSGEFDPKPETDNNEDYYDNPHNNDLSSGSSSDVEKTSAYSKTKHLSPTGFSHSRHSSFYKLADVQDSMEFMEDRTNDLKNLLDLLDETLGNNLVDLPNGDDEKQVTDLHMMSVLNIGRLFSNSNSKLKADNERTETLRRNLIDSLSQPFYELHERNQEDYSQRILHDFTLSRNMSPQAIFLCENESPWSFKSVNDISCLMFGLSRNSLRTLNLLDLIHKDSRNFVLNKLVVTDMERDDLVFTGEIIGIAQPSSNVPVWTSVWAKRRDGLIHFLFQKVPCDSLQCTIMIDDLSLKLQQPDIFFSFTNKNGCPGSKTSYEKNNMVKDLSSSLNDLVTEVKEVGYQDNETMISEVIKKINDQRYFTLNSTDFNIPCAITSGFSFDDNIKVNIHSLPYIAGAFIINTSSKDYNLISFNKSVSKNLFGTHARVLLNQPIKNIIPKFNAIIDHIHKFYPEYNINKNTNKSLVLTEHFIRKIDIEIGVVQNLIDHENFDFEFYNSTGINGKHKDGFLIKLDLQIKVLSPKYSMLWVTHSRDVISQNYNSMPSQLKILKDNEKFMLHNTSDSAENLISNDVGYDLSIKEKLEAAKKNDVSAGSSTTTLTSNSRKTSSSSLKKILSALTSKSKTSEKNEENKDKKESGSSSKENGKRNEKSEHTPLKVSSSIAKNNSSKTIESPMEIAKHYKQDKESFLQHSNFKFDHQLIVNKTSRPSTAQTIGSVSHVPEADGSVYLYTSLYDDGQNKFQLGKLKHKKKFSDFTILESMGRGAYGLVDLCMHNRLTYIVVLKRIIKERVLFDTWVRDVQLGTVPSEIHIMSVLNKTPHENIMFLLDFFEDDEYYYIETPIHGDTGSIDLFDLIEVKTDMTEMEVKLLFKQIVSGIRHLHHQDIIHRDIKDENVIVDGKGCVKIIDFGSATHVAKGPFDTFVGTIDYAPPEVLKGNKYDGRPQDCWSLGILLYTIVFKENPFYNIDEIMDAELKIPMNTTVSQECTNLIKLILNKDVTSRPDIDEIFNDVWLEI